MKSTFRMFVLTVVLLSVCSTGNAQYFGEQVMEKSFEHTVLFFTPYKLIPFGLGNFRNSVGGVLDDPLLNIELNPSYLYRDSANANYLYVDFRSSREIRSKSDPYSVYTDALSYRTSVATDILRPYPLYYVRTRTELEPVISAAYLVRPTEGAFTNLSLGVTYQMISQDEKYYNIPQDIYRSVVGNNYLGGRAAEAADIPIIDKYSGADDMNQRGHLVSLFSGYEIDPSLQLGLKLSRVSFDREGEFGSKNLWENYHSGDYTSLWSNREARVQDYGHWEVSAGANYQLSERYNIGVNGGRLWGDADQVLTRGDSSYWGYGPLGSQSQSWSRYSSSGNQRQTWNHDGRSYFAGIDLKGQVSQSQLVQVHYLFTKQNTDITLGGVIFDTSFGQSFSQWDTVLRWTNSYQKLADNRSGSGTSSSTAHRVVGSLQWEINAKVKVSIGAMYERRTVETATSENILANRHYRYTSVGSYPYSYFDSTAESKTLEWRFNSKLSRFTLPIFFSIRASEVVELLFGLNRSLSEWEIDDVTTAIFNYRVRSNANGTTEKRNFGERYIQPKERISDVQTTFLAGLTVAPSNVFNIRLLVVPHFTDTYDGSELSQLQWWIGMSLMP